MKLLALALLCAVAPARADDLQLLKPGADAPVLKNVNWLQGDAVPAWKAGDIYVLDFWATWCPPCKRSIPDIDKFADTHTKDNIHVIGVAVWPRDGMVPTPDFVKQKGADMSYGICEDDAAGTNATSFLASAAQNGIPCCMIIDQKGKLAFIGNPLLSDLPGTVAKISDGSWDTAAFAKDFVPKQEKDFQEIKLQSGLRAASTAKDWAKVADYAGQLFALDPESYSNLAVVKYGALVQATKATEASAFGRELVSKTFKDDPENLNGLAWSIVDPKAPKVGDLELAKLAADRANTLSNGDDFAVLDTLARVTFLQGDVAKAIELQQKALDKAPDEAKDELKARLQEYQTAKHG
jgi:thiol-disulfide isomerase/thioredoxin